MTYADAMDDSDKETWLEAMNHVLVGVLKLNYFPTRFENKIAEAWVSDL